MERQLDAGCLTGYSCFRECHLEQRTLTEKLSLTSHKTARYSVIAFAYSVLLEFRLLAWLTRFFVSVNWCVIPCVVERDVILQILFLLVRQPLVGQGLCIVEVLLSHSDTPHTIGLFWTSDQPVPETSTSVFLNFCETAAR